MNTIKCLQSEDSLVNRLVYRKLPDYSRALKSGVRVSQSDIDPQDTLETFESFPKFSTTDGFSDPTGVAGDENLMATERNMFEYHMLGTQTLLSPTFSASGLDLNGLDQTNNDGVEYSQGITARSKAAFTVGTDKAFFFQADFDIADVSGTDDCAVGFRKAEAYQANIDDYDEMACLNVISGDINIETIINGAATVTTDTTDDWVDVAAHTLRVKVSGDGAVTYEIDGAEPTTIKTFSFDAGEVVVPFFYILNAADVAGAINCTKWESGLQ